MEAKVQLENFVSINSVNQAAQRLHEVAVVTPLEFNDRLSREHKAKIFFKREDLQLVRSYKIRGSFNKILSLTDDQRRRGVVCASAGNHAQGVAFACHYLGVMGTVFMPKTTPNQKVDAVKRFGKEWVDIVLSGDTYDEAFQHASKFQEESNAEFVHPFDDINTIEGQATVALEILTQIDEDIDYLIVPIGGGGLASGLISVFKELSPNTKIIGIEPSGAPSMSSALEQGYPVSLERIDKFVDGAAVQKVGDLNFRICKDSLHQMLLAEEGHICDKILELYNYDAIVAEPAGVLSVVALDKLELEGKSVVCIVSGGNNDIGRMEEIKERAMTYRGLKHYFLVSFPQRSGALKDFLLKVLGEKDDIVHFEYIKKNYRSYGSAVVGVELKDPNDFQPLITRMKEYGFFKSYLNEDEHLLNVLV